MPMHVGSPGDVILRFLKTEDTGRRHEEEAGPLDLTARRMTATVEKPDGTRLVSQTMEVLDGPEGLARWVAEEGVLDQRGWWRVQGFADAVPSEVAEFWVSGNL